MKPEIFLMEKLLRLGASVSFYDPFIPVIRPSREHSHWSGTRSIEWTKESLEEFDVCLIATAHKQINYWELGQWSKLVIDTRNAMKGIESLARVIKA